MGLIFIREMGWKVKGVGIPELQEAAFIDRDANVKFPVHFNKLDGVFVEVERVYDKGHIFLTCFIFSSFDLIGSYNFISFIYFLSILFLICIDDPYFSCFLLAYGYKLFIFALLGDELAANGHKM
ncbi:MAG: hypothetical protein KDD45_18265 [Bdellovibrionales bacterium]|nr:hypothetical protein [Bdellovibrionales bacterium]